MAAGAVMAAGALIPAGALMAVGSVIRGGHMGAIWPLSGPFVRGSRNVA